MMKRDFRDKWVADLRSGEYTQAYQFLCYIKNNNPDDTSCRCCLGVAMESINISPTVIENWVAEGYENIQDYVDDNGSDYLYSVEFANQNELPSDDQLISMGISNHEVRELSSMNDGSPGVSPKTFNEIADYIMTLPVED